MKMTTLTSAAAFVVGLTLFDATPADAAPKGRSVVRKAPSVRSVQPRVLKAPRVVRKKIVPKTITKVPRTITKAPRTKGPATSFVKKSTIGKGALNLRSLPVRKAAVGSKLLSGRLAVPKQIKPKLTLAHAPHARLRPRFAPFVQRHWKQAFLWVAIAGIGYLTIPQLYYDRFYTCVDVDDPIYDDCLYILSYAALEEEEFVRVSMPEKALYRYEAEAKQTQECKSCTLEPFVERKWNRAFVWVQVPQTGNITVPEDTYDSFYRYASAEPPNYPAACKVLVEAAAADTVMTTALDTRRGLE